MKTQQDSADGSDEESDAGDEEEKSPDDQSTGAKNKT
jgi:hypothetical protein